MSEVKYRKCLMISSASEALVNKVAWIPEEIDKIEVVPGIMINLGTLEDGVSDTIWDIITVGGERKSADSVPGNLMIWKYV